MGKVSTALGKDIGKKTVAIAGLGSLGTKLAEDFARMGVKLRIVDMGRVEPEDLETMSLFVPGEETKFKAKEAKKHLEEINPKASVKCFHEQLKDSNVFLLEADVIIDCTQDWEASSLINGFCKQKKIPQIYTKLAGSEGIILANKAAYNSKKLQPHADKLGTVADKGLLPNTLHMAASIAMTKTLKILTGEKFSNKLYHFNTWKMTKRESTL
ncbi:ThiF family adenylyltransferase [Nanoarchaeota archaeon]